MRPMGGHEDKKVFGLGAEEQRMRDRAEDEAEEGATAQKIMSASANAHNPETVEGEESALTPCNTTRRAPRTPACRSSSSGGS